MTSFYSILFVCNYKNSLSFHKTIYLITFSFYKNYNKEFKNFKQIYEVFSENIFLM